MELISLILVRVRNSDTTNFLSTENLFIIKNLKLQFRLHCNPSALSTTMLDNPSTSALSELKQLIEYTTKSTVLILFKRHIVQSNQYHFEFRWAWKCFQSWIRINFVFLSTFCALNQWIMNKFDPLLFSPAHYRFRFLMDFSGLL